MTAEATKARRWLIAVAVALGALLEIVDVSIVNVALPQMQSSLGVTLSEVGWVITSYAIAMAATFLPDDAPRKQTGGVDWLGIALLALGLGALQTFLEDGYSEGWFDSTFVCVCAAVAEATLALASAI